MNVQARNDEKRRPFILDGSLALSKGGETLLQDAGRVTDLAFGTLMAKVAASGKWVPFISEIVTTGAAIARGIYVGPAILAADIVAGDVLDIDILVGGNVKIDGEQLIIEGGKTLATVFGAASIHAKTVEDQLTEVGIFIGTSVATTSFEN